MVRHAPDPRRRGGRDLAGAASELPDLDGTARAYRKSLDRLVLHVPPDDRRLIEAEARRRGLPKAHLVVEWIEPRLAELRSAAEAERDAA